MLGWNWVAHRRILLQPAPMSCQLRPALAEDVPLILRFIRELATYEKLLAEVEADEARLRDALFPSDPATAPAG
jgi:hypothetical protein